MDLGRASGEDRETRISACRLQWVGGSQLKCECKAVRGSLHRMVRRLGCHCLDAFEQRATALRRGERTKQTEKRSQPARSSAEKALDLLHRSQARKGRERNRR